MNVEKFEIPGLMLLEPRVFKDERGYFTETYSKRTFADLGIHVDFVQDNASRSHRGVIRGLHFQRPPHAQDKLVRVVQGEVMDVVVDLRVGSPTFGKHQSVILSAENQKIFFIPKGFAHGFVVLSESADFEYKVSDLYYPETEGGILWSDPDLAINWHSFLALSLANDVSSPLAPRPSPLLIGAKDLILPLLKDLPPIFTYAE